MEHTTDHDRAVVNSIPGKSQLIGKLLWLEIHFQCLRQWKIAKSLPKNMNVVLAKFLKAKIPWNVQLFATRRCRTQLHFFISFGSNRQLRSRKDLKKDPFRIQKSLGGRVALLPPPRPYFFFFHHLLVPPPRPPCFAIIFANCWTSTSYSNRCRDEECLTTEPPAPLCLLHHLLLMFHWSTCSSVFVYLQY